MGRKKLSADVVELFGNRSKLSKAEIEARRDDEVQAPKAKGAQAPGHLSTFARECWAETAPELERLGLLSTIDLRLFEELCEAYALARSALEAMRPKKADGTPDLRRRGFELVLDDPHHGGVRKHPAFAVWNMSTNTYAALCARFGISPLSRVGLRPGTIGKPGTPEAGAGAGDDGFDFGT